MASWVIEHLQNCKHFYGLLQFCKHLLTHRNCKHCYGLLGPCMDSGGPRTRIRASIPVFGRRAGRRAGADRRARPAGRNPGSSQDGGFVRRGGPAAPAIGRASLRRSPAAMQRHVGGRSGQVPPCRLHLPASVTGIVSMAQRVAAPAPLRGPCALGSDETLRLAGGWRCAEVQLGMAQWLTVPHPSPLYCSD